MRGLKLSELDSPYETQWEIIEDVLYWLDLRISCLYEHHAWLGVDNNMQQLMGVVVSKNEFELRLENAAEMYIDNEKYEYSEDAYLYIEHRLSLSDVSKMPIFRLFNIFDMSYMEKACLIIAIASHLDEKYARIFAYLQDDISKRKPGIRLAVLLCARDKDLVAKYEYEIKNSKALSYIIDDKEFENNELVLNKYILSFLLFNNKQKSFENED